MAIWREGRESNIWREIRRAQRRKRRNDEIRKNRRMRNVPNNYQSELHLDLHCRKLYLRHTHGKHKTENTIISHIAREHRGAHNGAANFSYFIMTVSIIGGVNKNISVCESFPNFTNATIKSWAEPPKAGRETSKRQKLQ